MSDVDMKLLLDGLVRIEQRLSDKIDQSAASVKDELRAEMRGFRDELKAEISEVKMELCDLKQNVKDLEVQLQESTQKFINELDYQQYELAQHRKEIYLIKKQLSQQKEKMIIP